MIVQALIDIFFSVVSLIFGWLPEESQLTIVEKTTDIFGFGVWVLGERTFNTIVTLGLLELGALISWSLGVFIWRLVRG